MRRLKVFNNISLDGYFVNAKGDMSWAHQQSDDEWDQFSAENASGGGELLFGRVTYEMMVSFWPTEAAHKSNPVVAEQMNSLPKVVFSRTMSEVSWENTTLVSGDIEDDVRKRKAADGPGLVIMGSGTIVSQLAPGRTRRRIPAGHRADRVGRGTNIVRERDQAVHAEPHQ